MYNCFVQFLVASHTNTWAEIRNMWKRLPNLWHSGVSYMSKLLANIGRRVQNIPARIKLPGFHELCAHLGKDVKPVAREKTYKKGDYAKK